MKFLCKALLWSCFLLPAAHADFDFEGVKRLEMKLSEGSVRVAASPGAVTRVNVFKKRYDERCSLTIEKQAETLYIRLGSKRLYSARCEADFRILVPSQVALHIQDSSGEVSLRGSQAPLEVVNGKGKVRVVFEKVPDRGLFSIESKHTSAEVVVPAHAKVRAELSSSGSVQNLVGASKTAEFKISMKSSSGDLRILPSLR